MNAAQTRATLLAATLSLVAVAIVTFTPLLAREPGATEAREIAFEADVLYAQPDGEELRLDVAWPAKATAPAPGVVVLHGGGWTMGDRKSLDGLIRKFAAAGRPAATVSYRFAPKHPWPAQIEDAKAAVRFLRRNAAKYGMDPERMGAIGFSAGAHLAMMLGVTGPADGLEGSPAADDPSSRVQAVVSWFGPTDLTATDFPDMVKPLLDGLLGHGAAGISQRAHFEAAHIFAQQLQSVKSTKHLYFIVQRGCR